MKKMLVVLSAVLAFAAGAGVLPEGYEQLDYICSTGAQYLNTGYTPASTDKIEVKVHTFGIKGAQSLFCARGKSGANTFTCFIVREGTGNAATSNGMRFRLDYKSTGAYGGLMADQNTDYLVVADGNTAMLTVNGEAAGKGTAATFTAGGPLVLFASCNYTSGAVSDLANYATERMHYCKVTDKDGNVKLDLVPCQRTADGALGLYDLAGDDPATAFRASDSATPFVADVTGTDWYLTKTSPGDDIFGATLAPTVWKDSSGNVPAGAIGGADVCHIENGYNWGFTSTREIGTFHLGAEDGSSAASITCGSAAVLGATVLYWHSGSWSTSYGNRQIGLKGNDVYFDCPGKTHSINVKSGGIRFFLASNFHCDETDLVLTLGGTGSGVIDLSGDNADYRGKLSLTAAAGIPLMVSHANALGDPTVPRTDALSINAENEVLTAREGVKLNDARGIEINESGFKIMAGTFKGSSGNGAFSFDCTSYELLSPISGNYGFTKTGTGTVTYTGDYTAGEIVVKEGKLIIGADASFPAGQPITVTNATLEVHQPLSNFTITELEGATVIETMDTIEVPFDTTTTNVTTVLRKRLTLSPDVKQPIKLSADYLVPCHRALELEVLRIAPGSADFTADDFDDQTTKTYGLPRTTLTVTKDADGTQHVVITTRPVVKSKADIGNSGGINGSASTWSDGMSPHEGADYLFVNSVGDYQSTDFKGDTLTVGTGAKLGFRATSTKFATKSGEPVIIYPGVSTDESYNGRNMVVSGSIRLEGAYEDTSRFNFYLKYGETGGYGGYGGRLQLDAALSGAGSIRLYGYKNSTSWNGICGNNTNYFGRILFDGNGSTEEFKGTQVRVKDWRNFGGRLDEFHADAVSLSAYAMVKAIDDVALTNDMNRGIRIANNGGFNCDAGKTFRTTWPVQLNGTMYKHGAGTLILGGAMSHDTGSTSNFFVRAGAIGILSDAAADGLTVKSTNDFAIIVSPESTAVNGFTGLNLAPPPGSDVLPKVTVRADSAKFAKGASYRLPICTVANDSGVTADTFVVERVPRYCCSIVAEPVDATTTRYSLNCAKPGLFIVVE